MYSSSSVWLGGGPLGSALRRQGTSSARLNARLDSPPAGIKRGDGRLNYHSTHLYLPWRRVGGIQGVGHRRSRSTRRRFSLNAAQRRLRLAARGHPPDRPLPILRLPLPRPLLLRRFFGSSGGRAGHFLRRCGGKAVLLSRLGLELASHDQVGIGQFCGPPVRFLVL